MEAAQRLWSKNFWVSASKGIVQKGVCGGEVLFLHVGKTSFPAYSSFHKKRMAREARVDQGQGSFLLSSNDSTTLTLFFSLRDLST